MKAKCDGLLEHAPDDGADSERIAMVTPRSQSIIGRAKELGDEMYGTKGHHDGDPSVRGCGRGRGRDDMSPEARLRYTPVSTSPHRFDNDGDSLRANGLPDGVWAVAVVVVVVTCYNEEKVWEKIPVSIIIDGRAMASQAVLNFWQNELGVFSSEVSPPSRPVSSLPLGPYPYAMAPNP